jgi:hypothetical protein
MTRFGAVAEGASVDELRLAVERAGDSFRDTAPVSAAEAAATILDEVRKGSWRILVGEDAKALDAVVRADPEAAYDFA